MRYLIDTHILIWALTGEKKFSKKVQQILTDKKNEIVVSVVSEWEIAIKMSVGKLKLATDIRTFISQIEEDSFGNLAIGRAHLFEYINLPLHHRDPFDRLLIAQAKQEQMTLITADKVFQLYDVPVIWNED